MKKAVAILLIIACLFAVSGGGERPASGPAAVPAGARVTDDGWFAPRARAGGTARLPEKIANAFVIPVREEITPKTYETLKRKVMQCRGKGADLVIIDMDTWGGMLHPALDITRDLIKTALKDIYVVCYVRTRAVSAGAMIAVACDEIVMSEVGKFGDCAPIVMGGTLEGTEREKIETVVRTEFEESAERNGYPVPLSTSMVSIDEEVWLVRNTGTRELRYVDAENFRDRVVNPPNREASAEKSETDETAGETTEDDAWEFLRVAVKEGKLLTMTPEKARAYGFADRIVPAPDGRPYANLVEEFAVSGEPTVLKDNWSERLAELITGRAVSSILTILMLIFAFSEMKMPGFGVCGGLALVCLLLLLFGHYLVGLANWWEIALFAVGILLILAEILVIPGFGVAGILGFICILAGGLAMLVPNLPDEIPIPDTGWAWRVFEQGLMDLFLALIVSVIGMVALARYLPRLPWAGRLVLRPARAGGGSPRPAASALETVAPGRVGVTESVLRPVGQVRFDEGLFDASSETGMIRAGTTVRVLRTDGNRIIVEEAKHDTAG